MQFCARHDILFTTKANGRRPVLLLRMRLWRRHIGESSRRLKNPEAIG